MDLAAYFPTRHGVITRRHALELGLTREQIDRRVSSGAWLRRAPGVYQLATAPITWSSTARAASLSAGGLVSHTAALRVWQVDGWRREAGLHIVTRQTRPVGAKRLGATVHRVDGYEWCGGRMVDGVPVVEVTPAVVQAASGMSAGMMDATIDAVVRQGLSTVEELVAALDLLGSRGRARLGVFARLLAERDSAQRVPDSRFNRLVGQLLVAGGLPEPVFEYEVRSGGRLIGRVDLAYPQQGVAIECDSARWHHSRAAFEADPKRKNLLTVAGWRVLAFTWHDYSRRPNTITDTVAEALRLSG